MSLSDQILLRIRVRGRGSDFSHMQPLCVAAQEFGGEIIENKE